VIYTVEIATWQTIFPIKMKVQIKLEILPENHLLIPYNIVLKQEAKVVIMIPYDHHNMTNTT